VLSLWSLPAVLLAVSPIKDGLDRFHGVGESVSGAEIDWTRRVLSASASAQSNSGALGANRRMIESEARSRLAPVLLEAARDVRVSSEIRAGDLLDAENSLSRLLDKELSSWHVVETRYFASGKVEVDGELGLDRWLRPALRSLAAAKDARKIGKSSATGVVIDARGLAVRPALAPRVLSPRGEVLYSVAQLSQRTAAEKSLVQYVSDPADPRAVELAGDSPLFFRADGVRARCDLVLTSEDTVVLKGVIGLESLLATAPVVIVADSI
jgi:hypothetical protein